MQKNTIDPMRLQSGMSVVELVDVFKKSGSFNAGRLADACRLYEKMLDEDATVALTIGGAMIPTGLGGAIISMIEKGYIDFIISTGANLYHDLHFALDLPVYQGDFRVDDRELLKDGVVRIYDIFITEELLKSTDHFLQNIFRSAQIDCPMSSSELHHFIGVKTLEGTKYPEKSMLAQAAKYDVPIYTPSPGDSSIGMNLAAVALEGGRLSIDPNLDVLETAAIIYSSSKNGGVIIGGGAPKNFYLQTQPTLSQILGINRGGHDYVIQIGVEPSHYGSLSGATPQEAITWGKVKPSDLTRQIVIYSDATIAIPILFSYILSKKTKRRLRRLYQKRPELLQTLKQAVKTVH